MTSVYPRHEAQGCSQSGGTQNRVPMGVAGPWSAWRLPTGWVDLYTMLTINADQHPLFKLLHQPQDKERMVVILHLDSFQTWLTGAEGDVMPLIRQCPADVVKATGLGFA